MAASRRLVRSVVVIVVGAAVLVLNPLFGLLSGPSFGATEMRAAVEGTWQLTVTPAGGAQRSVTFALAQSSEDSRAHASRGWIRPAAACGTRSLVKTAGACLDLTRMPLEITVLADGAPRPEAEPGEFVVGGVTFESGELRVGVAELMMTARITPRGEVNRVESRGRDGHPLLAMLVRVAH